MNVKSQSWFWSTLTLLFITQASHLSSAQAAQLKLMNFNTMCDLCKKKKEYGQWKERFENLVDTVKRHEPDLISFQEFRTRAQIEKMGRRLGNQYSIHYAKGFPLSYADPVLFVRKSRFIAKNAKGLWLGKRLPKFSFGWKFAIPRRMQWVTITDKTDGKEFLFIGTHFDNHGPNKLESSKFAAQFFEESAIPVIFAGDTNSNETSEGYAILKSRGMRDTFLEASQTDFIANQPYHPNDACGDNKASTFPNCRIDHVMVSPKFPMRVKKWAIDLFRYSKWNSWVSDHRAVVVEFDDQP